MSGKGKKTAYLSIKKDWGKPHKVDVYKRQVLSRVVVPEYVVVHDGPPNDTTARDYYVRYKDYIKNVASSEIYSTWPDATLRANILAIMSFTLNRVYTEWYRNKGYSFTITSSTAYDQKFTYGRKMCIRDSLLTVRSAQVHLAPYQLPNH